MGHARNLSLEILIATALAIASCNDGAHNGDGTKKVGANGGDLGTAREGHKSLPNAPTEQTVPVAGEGDEAARPIVENPFETTTDKPLSTFSIDVDTASYALARSELKAGRRPDAASVRIEEFINYFPYELAGPADEHPFAVTVDAAAAPWAPEHRLARIALKGRDVPVESRPAANLVFLVDVSGSMSGSGKLPLVKHALKALTTQLTAADRVAIVTYAGASGLALPATPGDQGSTIVAALDDLQPGGGTNGEQGIALAYSTASANFIQDGVNRVILCTDGDFNVGQTSGDALVELIRQKAEGGIFLTALGFGMSYNDPTLETLADKGNGVHGYIDTEREAERMMVRNVTGTLLTIAKDVKIQVAFDPAVVAKHRLVGYENRVLADKDFADDKKDAGEIGAGHSVTALYELELAPGAAAPYALGTVKLRYKQPDGEESIEMETPMTDAGAAIADAAGDLRFAAAVAGFGMLLRGSIYAGAADWTSVGALAEGAVGADVTGERRELVQLIGLAGAL